MAIKFARFNIQLLGSPDVEIKADEWQALINDAAIEGYADDYEVFYLSQRGVVGLSVPYEDDDPMLLLEAGAALGFCQSRCESSDIGGIESMWLSLHDADDSTIDSPIE
jgi:hypothetical protein